MIPELKIGLCIAYDWEMLKTALPLFYNHVDKICLSLDINRRTWAGNAFHFDERDFFDYVKNIDVENKIDVYQDDFYQDKINPMNNEVYQRNQIAKRLGEGGWHIQIDVDEYFIDFEKLAFFLRNNYQKFNKEVNICLPFYIMFKKLSNNSFFIKGIMEWVPVVTNYPKYVFGRRNGYFNYKFDSPIIHQSWARSETEIQQKISNWGHKNDFDVQQFFEKWKKLDVSNYKEWLDFHPIDGKVWHELVLIEGKTIKELIDANKSKFEILKTDSAIKIKLQNSRIFSKISQLLKIKW